MISEGLKFAFLDISDEKMCLLVINKNQHLILSNSFFEAKKLNKIKWQLP
jgi:hypothetical protein